MARWPRAGVDPTPQATALCPPGGVAVPRGLSTASPVESCHPGNLSQVCLSGCPPAVSVLPFFMTGPIGLDPDKYMPPTSMLQRARTSRGPRPYEISVQWTPFKCLRWASRQSLSSLHCPEREARFRPRLQCSEVICVVAWVRT